MPRTLFSPRPPTSELPAILLKGQPDHPKTVSTPQPRQESTPKPTHSASLPHNHTKPIKVRVLTWNMHDSLPKGDLGELFGDVPPYDPSATKPDTFPLLPQDSNHPYHLVVVAGQECPTPSGIPMGLSASLKMLDKEREKPKPYDKDLDKSHVKQRDEDSTPVNETNDNPSSGWTSMVEDYLCHGSVSLDRPTSPIIPELESPEPLKRQSSSKVTRKGPYTLLVKERLMGIYMAIYIHRDVKPFVRGISKSAVTAGLIGGRVGNKGGVGISLDIGGITFLFLNAHLAAHEGKIHHRLANLTKIKTELSVNDFLPAGDPRSMAEDLTDRFDFTFLCGDLNFRLDISRLHADWLIGRGDFRQAFEFDQLNVLMKHGTFFKGFREAPIDFPPTFKYDVLRTLKRSKKRKSSIGDDRPDQITPSRELEVLEEMDDGDEEIEGDSLVSSSKTSNLTRPPTQPETDDEACFFEVAPTLNNHVASPRRKKPKLKWLSIFSPTFIPTPNKLLNGKTEVEGEASPSPALRSNLPSPLPSRSLGIFRKRPPPILLVDSPVPQGLAHTNEASEEEKGVYDSSNKKRVPSWCDRVLWKSTVQPSSISKHENILDVSQSPRNRVGHFFANAFRPLSFRTTWDDSTPLGLGTFSGEVTASTPNDFVSTQSVSMIPSTPQFHQSIDSKTRRENTSISPPTTAPALEYPYRRFTVPEGEEAHPVERPQTTTHSIWRFLPSFLSPTHNQSHFPQHTPSSLPVPPPPLKGDVVCLSYNTLDDREMRHLEGRSDHRPVIGTYIVYA